jgi:hypothetical protein
VPRRSDDTDPFSEPEALATDVFVNELRCVGRRCSSSCVAAAPAVFAWAPDTGAARAIAQDGAAYALRVAVGQCPTECIHFVTPRQRAVLEAQLLSCVLPACCRRGDALPLTPRRRGARSAREGTAAPDDVGVALFELLARAAYENGRERGPRRTPKATSEYVDWF